MDTNTILTGADPTEGITAVETGEEEAIVYVRTGGSVRQARVPFSPWLLVQRKEDVPPPGVPVELEGSGLRIKALYPRWSDLTAAVDTLRGSNTVHLAYTSPAKQLLTASGMTLFKGLTFADIRRMQVDIETTGFTPESGNIILIAISDNHGFETLLDGEEPDMLARLISIVAERDPDVIEGHNIFGFDLPFISARAEKHGIQLALGRDGSQMTWDQRRFCPIGGYSRPFIPARIRGRHVIDTLFAVQRYDVGRNRLERYGLKECARVLGIAEPERIIIPGDEIAEVWRTDPERVKIYSLHDVRETRKLAELVCPPEFYVTQMVPDTYENAATGGTGEKINSIMLREYLRRGHAVPLPQPQSSVPGGHTEIRRAGLVRRIVKCDVESLYPSLMLIGGIKPASDALDVFLPALSELTAQRIQAKTRSKSGPPEEREYWDGLQNSYKILINSFYGYLGTVFNFNDHDAAGLVTARGRETVIKISDAIEAGGGSVIEIDTDGVYFEPPAGVQTEEDEISFVEHVGSALQQGINLVHDGRYAAMLSLKIKNYVLIGYDGRRVFKGSAVRSRADERFGREFISEAVDLLIQDDKEGIGRLYRELASKIKRGELTVEEFSRRERVSSKTFNSPQKKRMSKAAKSSKPGDYISIYEKVNGELGLAEEYNSDENRTYLIDRLYKFALRLREAFGDEFDTLFPRPGKNGLEDTGLQDLF